MAILFETKKDFPKACLFGDGDLFCFIGDLQAMNNYLKFSKNCQDTYSSEIDLKREITSSSEVSLLDLPLKIKKNNLRLSYLIRETNFPFQ